MLMQSLAHALFRTKVKPRYIIFTTPSNYSDYKISTDQETDTCADGVEMRM